MNLDPEDPAVQRAADDFVAATGSNRATALVFLDVARLDVDKAVHEFRLNREKRANKSAAPILNTAPYDRARFADRVVQTALELSSPPRADGSRGGSAVAAAADVCVMITLWKEGFTVGDGPLRLYADSANEPFMRALERGVVPKELAPDGVPLDVQLVDRREEPYGADGSRNPFLVFAPTRRPPATAEGSASAETKEDGAPAAPPSSEATPFSADVLAASISVDAGQPTTTVLVVPPGERRGHAVTVNLSTSVGQLRAAVAAALGKDAGSITLQSGMPPWPLMDDDASVEGASLCRARLAVG